MDAEEVTRLVKVVQDEIVGLEVKDFALRRDGREAIITLSNGFEFFIYSDADLDLSLVDKSFKPD